MLSPSTYSIQFVQRAPYRASLSSRRRVAARATRLERWPLPRSPAAAASSPSDRHLLPAPAAPGDAPHHRHRARHDIGEGARCTPSSAGRRPTPPGSAPGRRRRPSSAPAASAGSEDFDYLAKKDEPVKHEGDKRTPAGIFRVAGPFGFEPNKISGYTKLEPGRSFCVDDATSLLLRHDRQQASSPATRTAARTCRRCRVSSARSWSIIRRAAAPRPDRASSCTSGTAPTRAARRASGCPSRASRAARSGAQGPHTAIAIVPEAAVDRFQGCLPLTTHVSRNDAPAAVPVPNPMRQVDKRASGAPRRHKFEHAIERTLAP